MSKLIACRCSCLRYYHSTVSLLKSTSNNVIICVSTVKHNFNTHVAGKSVVFTCIFTLPLFFLLGVLGFLLLFPLCLEFQGRSAANRLSQFSFICKCLDFPFTPERYFCWIQNFGLIVIFFQYFNVVLLPSSFYMKRF